MSKKEDQLELPGLGGDPSLYRKLSEPFPTLEDADAALAKFYKGLYELRRECKLPDVYAVIGFNVSGTDDGEEGSMMGIIHCGDEMKRESMAAYALGKEQADRQSRISRIMGKNVVKALARKSKVTTYLAHHGHNYFPNSAQLLI